MIIFLDASGNIVVPASPEPIGRCSNDASAIYIVSPLPESAQIYLTFTLPNGEPLFGNLAEPTEDTLERDARQAADYLFGAGDLSAWRYKVPSPVTQYAGTVHYTVCTVMGLMRATASGTFNVSRGNKIILPDDPTAAQWDAVLAALEQENADNLNVWTAMFGEGGEPNNPKEGSLASQLIAAQEDCLSVRTEIYGKNGTPDAPEEGSLAAEVMNLGRDFGEIPGWSEDADADMLALRDTNGFVRTAMHADRHAFESGPAEDAVALGDARAFLPYDFTLHMDSSTYVLSFTVKNAQGDKLGDVQQVDLPLESVWVAAAYDAATKSIILTTRDGNTVSVDVAAITGGLVNRDDFDAEMAKKVDRTEEALKVYGTKGRGKDGNIIHEPYSVDISATTAGMILQTSLPSNSSFDKRVPTATFAVCDPQKAYQPATKQYVDNGLAEKLNTLPVTSGYWAYVTTPKNSNTRLWLSGNANASGNIPLYVLPQNSDTEDQGATINVTTPVYPYNAANKKWTEENFVPRAAENQTFSVYGTGGLAEDGRPKPSVYPVQYIGRTVSAIAQWQAPNSKYFDTQIPQCTIAVCDPQKPYQAANMRYVDGKVDPIANDVAVIWDALGGAIEYASIDSTTNPVTVPSNVFPAATLDKIGTGIKTDVDSIVSSVIQEHIPSGVTASYNDGLFTINSDEYVTDGIDFTARLSKKIPDDFTYYFFAEVVSGSYDISGEGDLFVADGMNAIKVGELFHGTYGAEVSEISVPINVMNSAVKYNNLVLRISFGETVSVRGVPVASVKKGAETVYTVPEAIRSLIYTSSPDPHDALPVYGLAMSDTVYNYLDLEKKQYVVKCQQNFMTGELEEKNATIDVSAYLTDEDGEITVAAGDEILFVDADGNSAGSTVASTITYNVKKGAS